MKIKKDKKIKVQAMLLEEIRSLKNNMNQSDNADNENEKKRRTRRRQSLIKIITD